MMIRFAVCLLLSLSFARAQDFRPLVDEALKKGDQRIVIPPGVYRLNHITGGELWKLHGLKNVEIIADGVTLVGTKLVRALDIDHCEGLSLQGLTVDYDPLPFTQGTVISGDDHSIDVKLHAGYPRKAYSRVDVLDPKTRFRKKGMPFLWGSKAEMVGEDVVRVTLNGISKTARPGDLISLSTGQELGAPHAISITNCDHLHFKNITVHSAPGMGILEADGEGNSHFDACHILPGPKPAGATEERLLSSSWDAFQSKTIKHGPLIENCEIRDAGDDSWSVQSSDFLVLKSEGNAVVLASRDEYTAGVQDGDIIKTKIGGPEFKITSRKTASREEAGLSAEVIEKLKAAKSWDHWKVSPKCIVVTLDKESGLKSGDSVYSPDRMGSGFIFRHNRVHSPGRILLKAGGLMENNLLDTPHALIVCPELGGDAAAGIENLIIRKNTIKQAGWFCAAPWSTQAGALSLSSSGAKNQLRTDSIFKNVKIEDNTFDSCSGLNLVVTSTNGISVRGNRFVSAFQDSPPDTGASYSIPKNALVWFAETDGISYEKNTIENLGSFAGKPVQTGKGVVNAKGLE